MDSSLYPGGNWRDVTKKMELRRLMVCHEIVKLTGTNISACDTGLRATGLTTNHVGTAKSKCCILPEIKSF